MTNRADIDPILDDRTDLNYDPEGWAPDEYWELEEREDIVYRSIECSDCGGSLPISFKRNNHEDYLRSLRLTSQAHICSAATSDVSVVTAEGTKYSLEEYLDR